MWNGLTVFLKFLLLTRAWKKALILYHIFDFCWGIGNTQHSTRTILSVFIIFFYSQSSKVSESALGGFSDVVSFRFLSPFQPPILRRQASFFLKTISRLSFEYHWHCSVKTVSPTDDQKEALLYHLLNL